MTDAAVLVELTRAGMVESQHRGHVVIVAGNGDVVGTLGDPNIVIYPRSAVKPLQVTGMIQAGLDLHGSDLALAEQARREFLASGAQPQRVVMNCSGKHAAMLTTCVINDWPRNTYLDSDHPLQIHLRKAIGSLAGAEPTPATTDGCGAPLWGLPLVALARAMVNMGSDTAGARVAEAMRQHPEYVGGTTRDVTHLMRGVPGLVAKDGAEGVQTMATRVAGQRFGIAIKLEDGAQRARPIVAAAALARLGLGAPVLEEHLTWPVLGGGRPVGVLAPSTELDDFARM